jgi:hypothetical protein
MDVEEFIAHLLAKGQEPLSIRCGNGSDTAEKGDDCDLHQRFSSYLMELLNFAELRFRHDGHLPAIEIAKPDKPHAVGIPLHWIAGTSESVHGLCAAALLGPQEIRPSR